MSRILNAQKLLEDARMSVTGPLAVAIQNAFTAGNPAGLNGAMGFTVDIFEQLQSRAYDVKMPDIKWAETLGEGLDTSINPGAKLTSYRVRDRRGKGAFRAAVGKDIPTVGVTQNKVVIPMESAAVMASADLDDIVSVAFGFEGMNLLTDLGVVMREAHDRQVEETFFFGFPELDFAGYIDYSLVPATTAGTKAGGGTTWAVATGDEIVKDVNTAIGLIYGNSKTVFMPNRVEIPAAQMVQIASQRMGGAAGPAGENETVLSYLKKNNLYTQLTGRELDIRTLTYLDGAGSGGSDRMIVSQADGETNYMPMSRAFEMLAPQDRQFATDLFAHWRFGSYHKPYPTSAQFIDGI